MSKPKPATIRQFCSFRQEILIHLKKFANSNFAKIRYILSLKAVEENKLKLI